MVPEDGVLPSVAEDAGTAIAGPDGGARTDGGAPIPDAGSADGGRITADAGTTPRDAGTVCTPPRATCNEALECGHIPDGCGGFLQCPECGDGSTWCIQFDSSRWQNRVYNCVQAARTAHPEWFDNDLVVAAYAETYVADVAACANGRGAVCIVDRNAPGNEIRCREETGDVAENIQVRTYGGGGRWVSRYTSSCTPAFF
jgi:hypothetical protein